MIILLTLLWLQPLTINWILLLSTLFFYSTVKTLQQEKILRKNFFITYNLHLIVLLLVFTIYNSSYLLVLASYLVESSIYHTVKHYAALQGYP